MKDKKQDLTKPSKIAQEATEQEDVGGVVQAKKSLLEAHSERLGVSQDAISCIWDKSPQASVRIDNKKRQKFKEPREHIQRFLQASKSHVIRPTEAVSDPCMLVMGLHDAHFGKLTWNRETGEDYDLEIAAGIYRQAVTDTLRFFGRPNVERIIFPIGSDFFHSNNFRSETEGGTRIESVDDRMSKVFDCGVAAVVSAIEDCIAVADTEVVWIPGNHDRESSWYLARLLGCKYENSPYVKIDYRDTPRKYVRYGTSLIGLTHKPNKKLPLVMSVEAPQDWGSVTTREIMTGHLHQRRTEHFVTCYEDAGIVHRILPSLSATDAWHHSQGFVGSLRAAEAFLYSYEGGYHGSCVAKVKK